MQRLERRSLLTATLGTTSLVEGPAAGSDSDLLVESSPTATWTASTTTSWLTVAPGSASGTGSATVIFTFAANTSDIARIGTITIDGLTLTVTQAPANDVATNAVATLAEGEDNPVRVALDGSGNVYISVSAGGTIKEWSPSTNAVTTIVSSGLSYPSGVAVDASGNVYIADYGHNAIKEWSPVTKTVTTLISGITGPKGMAIDSSGNLYIALSDINTVVEWSASTKALTTLVSSGLNNPLDVGVDAQGNVYIADTNNNAIKEWSPSTDAVTTLISSGLDNPSTVAVDGSGNLYIADRSNNAIKEWSPSTDTLTTLVASGLSGPRGVAVDGSGNVYIADSGNGSVKEMPRAYVGPTATTVGAAAGSGDLSILPADENLAAPFTPTSNQSWLTVGSIAGGEINYSYTANMGATSRTGQITVLGQELTVTQNAGVSLGATSLVEGPAAGSDSDILAEVSPTAAWTATTATSWLSVAPASASGTGNATIEFSFLANTCDAARTGTITIAGLTLTVTQAPANDVAANSVTALATGDDPVRVAVDGSGNVYIADSDGGTIKEWSPSTNTATTIISSGLGYPSGVAVDGSGNVYIADYGNDAIKEWSPATGAVTTLFSGLYHPKGMAIDSSGNLYIALPYSNSIVEWSASTQSLTTLVSSGLDGPLDVAVDAQGNVYIADTLNNAIKEWSPTTDAVTTLISSGLNNPSTVAVDGSGNLYIADTLNNAIKEWSPLTDTLTTLVASGLSEPRGVAVDGTGNVYIADSDNNAIKEMPRAYVGPTATTVGAAAGSGALTILPPDENLAAPFTPTSNQSWLTVGSIAGGEINYSYTENTGATSRTAQITVLGQLLTITQNIAAPIVTTTGSNTVTAGWSTVVDSGMTLTDANSSAALTATVSITGGFQSGDTLALPNPQNGITASYSSGTGVLTVTGNSATVAQFQTALQSITFTASASSLATRTISFVVIDANDALASNTASDVITVTTPAPAVATTGSNTVTAGWATIVDSGVTLTDINPGAVLSATVSITGGFQSGDTLAMADQNGITASYNSVTGVLTVTGNSATVAQFQTALQSITFTSTASLATRTISFQVTDTNDLLTSNTATDSITVDGPATITGIYVRGSGSGTGVNWTTNFLNYVDSHTDASGVALGSGTLGYALRTGSTQTTVLPWANINTITVTFSEPVTIYTGTSGLALYGSSSGPAVPTLSATTSTSGVTSITWTLSSDLGDDKYLLEIPTTAVLDSRNAPLDGAFTNGSSTFPSGTGLAGSANFGFTFNVLPGSAGQANAVSSSYATTARSHTNDLYNNGAYSPFYDLDGEGVISSAYSTFIRSHTDNILPSAAPTTGSGENTPLIEVDPGLVLDSSPDSEVDSSSLVVESSSSSTMSSDPATQNAASAVAQSATGPTAGSGNSGAVSQSSQTEGATSSGAAPPTATLAGSQTSQDSRNQAVDDALSDLDLIDLLV